ncbi:universal stress protein [Pleurocapsales cyanobacterium LEGE 10410]|nr:universal stress protein [Pleurocapsales cyanobacterium LEGE 10410]
MFNKILVAIDRSTAGKKVFEAAMSLAKTSGASLKLLHVLSSEERDFPTPTIYSGLEYDPYEPTLIEAYQERWQQFEQEGLEMLRGTAEEATKAGISTDFTQTLGNPGRTICDLAQTQSADLIVVGSRGRTGLKEMFLGSVSNYVTHHAPCSVLIVHQTDNLDPQLSESEQEKLTSSAA